MKTNAQTSPAFSIPSIIALFAAVISFSSGSLFGAVMAFVAVGFGVLGIILALSPQKRGGIVSIFVIVAGALGVLAAIIKGVMWIF